MARTIPSLWRGVAANLAFGVALLSAQAPSAEDWRELIEANRRLQAQVAAQQEQINALRAEVSGLARAESRRADEMADLREEVLTPTPRRGAPGALSELRLSGEAGKRRSMPCGGSASTW